jgi:hypothetical protein
MKLKYTFLAFFVVFALLFTTCDLFNGDNNNGNKTPTVGVEPLLKTKWNHQAAPFTNMIPLDDGIHSHAGYVAGAMAQIMKYHKYPARGIGQSEAYATQTKGIQVPSVNLDVAYDWDNMLDTYPSAASGTEQQRNAVATIMYHAGLAMKMNYNAGGSVLNLNTAPTLVTYFDYDKSIELISRSYFDNEAEWEAVIRDQLDKRLPVTYAAHSASGIRACSR